MEDPPHKDKEQIHKTADLKEVFPQEDTPLSKTKPQQIRPWHLQQLHSSFSKLRARHHTTGNRMRLTTVAKGAAHNSIQGRSTLQNSSRNAHKVGRTTLQDSNRNAPQNRPHHTTEQQQEYTSIEAASSRNIHAITKE